MPTKNTISKTQDSKLPDGWVEVCLGDVVEIKYGKDHKKLKEGKIPCYGSGGLMRNVEKFLYDKPSVLIPRKGTISNLFYVTEPFWTVDTLFYTKINEDKILSKFLFYKLKNEKLEDLNVGSAVPSLTTAVLKTFKLKLPPLPQQKAIASVLSSFDDKIELLREQNETLEKIGQEVFKEWFGKYKVGDDLPEGWRVGKLGDFGNIICGKTPLKNNKENFGGNIPFIKIPDMHNQMFILKTFDELSEIGANSQKNKYVPKNSICISCIATVGLVSITTKDSQTNQQINSIIPAKNMYLEYLYFSLKKMKKYLQDVGSGGTATLNINTSTFSNIEIIMPDNKTLEKFNQAIKPLFEKIKNNSEQIQTLSQNRDIILPRLMRGEVGLC